MGRSRNIKPGFFTNDDLVEMDFGTRLLFAGLWTLADRKGRLQDRPKKIKIDIFPCDLVDVDEMLVKLNARGFIVRYELDSGSYIQITNWSKHQNPHHTEKASQIPAPDDVLTVKPPLDNGALTVKEPLKPGDPPSKHGEYLADSLLLIPDSLLLIPDSLPLCAEPQSDSPLVLRIPLVDKAEFAINQNHVDEWVSAYPAVNVVQELRAIRAWSLSNPTKRKTKRGVMRFINSWLSKAQDKPGGSQMETFKERDARNERAKWEQMTGKVHPANLPKSDPTTTATVIDVAPKKMYGIAQQ